MPSTTSPPASSAPPSGSSSTADRAREWFHTYTRDLSREDLERLFTHDTRDAYDFFARGLDEEELATLPWWRRVALRFRQVFIAFTLKLPAARRAVYVVALLIALLGLIQLFRGFSVVDVPVGIPIFQISMPLPVWANGTFTLVLSLILVNLLMLLEVAERLSLKGELEVAREIQLALLPRGTYTAADIDISGFTKPANTVGGDFYDVLPQSDGTHHPDARRRRRQRQSGGAPHGAAPRRAAHARRRAHGTVGARRPAEHPDLPPQPGVALHHARLRDLRTRRLAGSRT